MEFKAESNFKWSILIICIIFDIVDTVLDIGVIGLSSFGIGTGLIEGLSSTLDFIMIVAGFLVFYIFGKDDISPIVFVPVMFDPLIDELFPIPSYTLVYIGTVMKGMFDEKGGRKR